MATILILLGAPGAGKGTQAVRLSKELGVPHVSTGDLFRDHLERGTPFGMKAKQFMDAGKLVPDDVVLDMLAERVAQPDCREGYLLDGFPRTGPQAEALSARLSPDDEVVVVNLEVDDETIIERITGRLVCRNCGNIQHRTFQPPKVSGVCDACGGELYQRSDDSADVVRERLRVYHEKTAPLAEYYSKQGVMTTIDGSREPEVVFEELQTLIAKRS